MNKIYASFGNFFLVVSIIAGICSIIIGSITAVKKYNKTHDYLTTTGRYVSHKEISRETDEDGTRVTYSIIYEYTVDNQTYQFEDIIGGTPPLNIDKTIAISYDASNPQDAALGGVAGYRGNIIAVVLGLFFSMTPIAFITENKTLKTILIGIVEICFIAIFVYFFIDRFKAADYYPIIFFTAIILVIFIKTRKYRKQQS